MRSAALSHIGLVRKSNEDRVFADEDLGLFIVADGVGGHEGGEIASSSAVDTVIADIEEKPEETDSELRQEILREAFYHANDIVYQQGLGKNPKNNKGMSTTMTALWLTDELINLAHVGDSRAYLISEGEIRQLTDDHSLVKELLKDGSISKDEAKQHPHRHIITRAIGQDAILQLDNQVLNWQKNDYLLLCSDGLFSMVDDQELLYFIIDHNGDLEAACKSLLIRALAQGGLDNISLVLVCNC
ncbi:MAG: Stp1/IreP family PP2C-type Ser/Thr phosphatase [Clostridiales bacterium]|nr:Stp1/IreP family PP2C-type Ser/Thr phosphatase [Clostridiales bacterium]